MISSINAIHAAGDSVGYVSLLIGSNDIFFLLGTPAFQAASPADQQAMLDRIGVESLEELFHAIPESLRLSRPLSVPPALSEIDLQQHMMELSRASKSAARRHWLVLTSRWVTARTVRTPKADTNTPSVCALATIVAASGALGFIRKITMLLCTVARSSSTPGKSASRSAMSLALA